MQAKIQVATPLMDPCSIKIDNNYCFFALHPIRKHLWYFYCYSTYIWASLILIQPRSENETLFWFKCLSLLPVFSFEDLSVNLWNITLQNLHM